MKSKPCTCLAGVLPMNYILRLLLTLFFILRKGLCCIGWPRMYSVAQIYLKHMINLPQSFEYLWLHTYSPSLGFVVFIFYFLTNNYWWPLPSQGIRHFDKSSLSLSQPDVTTPLLCGDEKLLRDVSAHFLMTKTVLTFHLWMWIRGTTSCSLHSSPKTGKVLMMSWYGTPTMAVLVDSLPLRSVGILERKQDYQLLNPWAEY